MGLPGLHAPFSVTADSSPPPSTKELVNTGTFKLAHMYLKERANGGLHDYLFTQWVQHMLPVVSALIHGC
jgi:hypothetical protein